MVDRFSNNSSSNYPSFSSTLLDSIYRSIDSSGEAGTHYIDPTMRTKKNLRTVRNETLNRVSDRQYCVINFKSDEEVANYQRACMIEKWMEKKATTDHKVRRNVPAADVKVKNTSRKCVSEKRCSNSNSYSTSSSSSSEYFFSSSEAESLPLPKPKPVRTNCSGFDYKVVKTTRERRTSFCGEGWEQIPKKDHQRGFLKLTKSSALKNIYGTDLKKVRSQPISPGGKLAVFLNSIFSNGNNLMKKSAKLVAKGDDLPSSLKSTNTSATCSSASSSSRSCLVKTPSSSSGKRSNNVVKRSVTFSSVSMIIDNDEEEGRRLSHGHKMLDQVQKTNSLKTSDVEFSRDSSIRSVNNQKHVMQKNRDLFDHDSNEDEDDAASYASSDLFELDNLSSIGMEISSYRDELPVYETTRLENNRIIGNATIM